MVSRATARWIVVLGMTVLAAACTEPMKVPGPDRVSDTNATMITWTDGKQAIQITCGMPGDTTLNMDNMPTRGDASVVRGQGTVVVRCAA
jgi:hypothetical protein